jgi:hypothetical protein
MEVRMMKKNKLFMIAALAFMISMTHVVALAQENSRDEMEEIMKNTTPAERADLQTNFMVEKLKLSDQQVEPIRAVNLKYAEKTGEIYNSQKRKFRKLKEMRKMRENKDKELKTILTDEQYKMYEKNKNEMRERIKDKRQSQS